MYRSELVSKCCKQVAIVIGCLTIAFVLYLLIDIEARVRKIESDVYVAEARVDAVKSEVESIKSNVSAVETKLGDAEATLGAIRTRNKSTKSDLRERVSGLESDMAFTKSRVNDIESRVEGRESDSTSVIGFAERMDKFEARMSQVESVATILMLDIKKIMSNIQGVESKMNAIEFSSARSRLAREMLR